MLYDPKWEAKTKPDVFSLESLIAWLEKMPARRAYCYSDTGHCLLGQYFFAQGKPASLGNVTVGFRDGGWGMLPEAFQKTAMPSPHTFGAALSRARALASK